MQKQNHQVDRSSGMSEESDHKRKELEDKKLALGLKISDMKQKEEQAKVLNKPEILETCLKDQIKSRIEEAQEIDEELRKLKVKPSRRDSVKLSKESK